MDFAKLIVLSNALILGIRHGIDWDHIAAIADIVRAASTTTTIKESKAISVFEQKNALRLSSCYAAGHAFIVLILGVAALMFAAVLPAWIDPFMEKAVGVTLLILGLWIFYSMLRQSSRNGELVLQSRWMFILNKIRQTSQSTYCRAGSEASAPLVSQYDAPAAFGIGIIHGFGAETGTQVLLIAAVAGSSAKFLGLLILLSFIIGLLISNTLVAILSCVGFLSSAKFKSLFVITSAIAALFSLIIGTIFVCGYASSLPNLQL